MEQLIALAEFVKPIVHVINLLLLGSLVLYSVYSLVERFDWPLALLTAGTTITLIITTIWLIIGLHTEWRITLFPKEVRQALYLFVQLCYPFEIIIWAAAFFLLIRRNRVILPSKS